MSKRIYNPTSLSSLSLGELTVSGAWLTNPIMNDKYKPFVPACELLEYDGFYGNLQILAIFIDVREDDEIRLCIERAINEISAGVDQVGPDDYDFDYEFVVKVRFPISWYFWLMKSFSRITCDPTDLCDLLRMTITDMDIEDTRDIYISLYGISESEWFECGPMANYSTVGHFLNWAKAYPFIAPRSGHVPSMVRSLEVYDVG